MQILSTHQLSIGYSQGRKGIKKIASNIDIQLQKGEFVCLIGPNGVGKSTLLRTLAGTQKPLKGNIQIEGRRLEKMNAGELARTRSVVLTDKVESYLSVHALVAMGRYPYTGLLGQLKEEDEKRVQWALKATDTSSYANRPLHQLSDGEQQKVMIARALAQDTPLILLDEPTAHLDLSNRVEIIRLLRMLSRDTQKAILLSTHDLELAIQASDRIWLMDYDSPIKAGVPEDLVLSDSLDALFRSESFSFDKKSGTFRLHHQSEGKISLTGQGEHTYWTRRALERVGFEVSESRHTEQNVQVHPGPPIRYEYQWNSHTGSCSSIEELLNQVTHL